MTALSTGLLMIKDLQKSTEVNVAVVELLTKTMFVNDVMKMSHLGQTSGVEAFHSVVNHFVPKMYYFSYKGMKSRIILAAMHYNENAGRPQNVTKEGIHSYCIVYPKYKSGGYSLRKILLDATYDYVNDCLSEVMKLIAIQNKYRTGDVCVDPQFLTAALNRPDRTSQPLLPSTRLDSSGNKKITFPVFSCPHLFIFITVFCYD
ncbi:uncharacterized protein LOC109510542 isoform X4 [Hippocampus comes]|uniref:uncharacterized protein LOC109510542 isoform X4 n=1 Tax=Hippocampus comes TaxID=109280 RepID=UPI00094E4F4A|nr:PREDICTED: uncharacterized protein LOC109510542 isoform X4 [Hippocampus comes]